jgi:hypothetical protein
MSFLSLNGLTFLKPRYNNFMKYLWKLYKNPWSRKAVRSFPKDLTAERPYDQLPGTKPDANAELKCHRATVVIDNKVVLTIDQGTHFTIIQPLIVDAVSTYYRKKKLRAI